MNKTLLMIALLVLPSPSWAQPPAIRDALTSSRALYPTPMAPAQVSEMLSRALVNHPGWALLRKDGGNNCPTPYQGIGVSCDWIIDVPSGWGYDVLYDQEGTGRLVWTDGVPNGVGISTVPAWPVGTQPTPTVPPPVVVPPPTSGTVTPDVIRAIVSSEVDKVYAQNERIFANVSDNILAILGKEDALRDQLKAHDEKTNKILAFFGDGKTITAIATAISTWFALSKAKN